jgi:hypothetical protein
MLFCLFLRFSSFFLCLPVYFVEDDGELVDGSGWLLGELGWGPPEFFAEAEVRDGWVRFLASDGSDKKAVSSSVIAHKPLTILESSSPSAMGMPFSSPKSLSSVKGSWRGCSLSVAQIVSAWIAMKSLLTTCPETGWYRVCFWIMRLRFAHVSSWKTYLPAYSSPYSLPRLMVSVRILNHLHCGYAVGYGGVHVFKDDGLHPLGHFQDAFAELFPHAKPFLAQFCFSAEVL